MEKNTSHILDIHTHKSEEASRGRAIINYQLPVGGALCLSSFYSAGIHPWQLTERDAEEQLAYLQKLLVEERLVAVGEAGLDKLAAAPMELQVRMFGKQVELSEKYRLPLVIHCVKAFNELIELKKKYRPQMPWVVHGFRNNLHIACRLMQENIYFSLGERYQPDVLRHVPLECLLAETDESTQDIRMVIGRMAETKNVEVSFLCDRIDENARKIFFRQ